MQSRKAAKIYVALLSVYTFFGMEVKYGMEYGRKFWYGVKYGMEDFKYGMEMKWTKITSMEYGKIVFHSINVMPC